MKESVASPLDFALAATPRALVLQRVSLLAGYSGDSVLVPYLSRNITLFGELERSRCVTALERARTGLTYEIQISIEALFGGPAR